MRGTDLPGLNCPGRSLCQQIFSMWQGGLVYAVLAKPRQNLSTGTGAAFYNFAQ